MLCGPLALLSGCAHVEAAAPSAPGTSAEASAATPPSAPATTLRVSSVPIESLRSAYISALEVTFQNPSGEWHEVRRVSIAPERQLFGPALEPLSGERLRAWQLATGEAHASKGRPLHPALEALAPEGPAKAESGSGEVGSGEVTEPAAPPGYLLAGPFIVAPGLSTRRWVALYSAAPDALLGQDLVLSYELENGQVERVLVHYPKPEPGSDP